MHGDLCLLAQESRNQTSSSVHPRNRLQMSMDSALLTAGPSGVLNWAPNQQLHHRPQMQYAEQLDSPGRGHSWAPHPTPHSVVPGTYINPALTSMLPPHIGMEHPYHMQRPQMWPAAPLQNFVPQYAMPPVQLHAQGLPSHANPATASTSTSAPLPSARLQLSGPGVPNCWKSARPVGRITSDRLTSHI
jgi:hypothetical protein